jgi:hypothetical protein
MTSTLSSLALVVIIIVVLVLENLIWVGKGNVKVWKE